MNANPVKGTSSQLLTEFESPANSQNEQSQRVRFLMAQIRMACENCSLDDARIARNIYLSLQPSDTIPENVRLVFQNHLHSQPRELFAGLQSLQLKKN